MNWNILVSPLITLLPLVILFLRIEHRITKLETKMEIFFDCKKRKE